MPEITVNMIHEMREKHAQQKTKPPFVGGLRTGYVRAWVFVVLKVWLIVALMNGVTTMATLERNVALLDDYIRNDYSQPEIFFNSAPLTTIAVSRKHKTVNQLNPEVAGVSQVATSPTSDTTNTAPTLNPNSEQPSLTSYSGNNSSNIPANNYRISSSNVSGTTPNKFATTSYTPSTQNYSSPTPRYTGHVAGDTIVVSSAPTSPDITSVQSANITVQNVSNALIQQTAGYVIAKSIEYGFVVGNGTSLRGCLYVAADGIIHGAGTKCNSGGGGGSSVINNITGGLAVGDAMGGATQGSVLFSGAAGVLAQDNSNFFWDNSTKRLGIGDSTPLAALTVGSGDAFQVDSTGAIAAATGIVSSGTVKFTGLGGSGTQCVQVNNLGVISGTGAGCGVGGGGGSGADTSLSNLSSVAINTSLLLGISDGGALGSATKMWSDLFLASGAVVNFNNGDVTLTHSTDTLTVGGGDLKVTSPGDVAGSVLTTNGTQTVTNKDLSSGTNTFPTFNQSTTGSAARWTFARNIAGNSVDGSADVPFTNKFIAQGTSDLGLSGAQFLGALGTGIVKNTTTTGVLSIATAGDFPTFNQNTTGSAATLTTPRAIYGNNFDGSAALTQIINPAFGGTGAGSFTTNGVLYGNSTSAIQATAQGGANTVLVANNGAPTFTSTVTIGTSVSSPSVNGTTSVTTPLLMASGTLGITPASGSNVNVNLATTGNFTVGSASQFQVDANGKIIAATGMTTTGMVTLTDLAGGGIQCLQISNAGTISATGAACGVGGSGANPALSNLSSVAINTDLVLGVSDTGALGSATKMWSDLFLASGAVVNFNNGDVTLTHSTDTLTVGGGDLKVTTPGNVSGSVVTTDATQSLSNKNFTSGTNTFPTFNQNTTGSAATLTTPRSIYGNNFDGSAALNQIIASTYGGTGNGFTKFTGPATTERTFTLPNADATILTSNAAVTLVQGGTGQTSFTNGDLPYYNSVLSTTQLSKLAIGGNGTCLISNGTIPSWGSCGTGTVTAISVASANGFAGSSSGGSTPALTLSTTVTGILKGNGTAISAALAGDFPTLNQNTTGSAATLTTPRAIYGNNFDGSAALTQTIALGFGGTGQSSFTNGDLPYYNSALSTTSLSKLTIGGNGTCLTSNGAVPTWSTCAGGGGISLAPSSPDTTSSTNSIENITATGLTSGNFLNLKTTTSAFTGAGILMDFANASGSYSGNFIDARVNTVAKFVVSSSGTVTTGIWNGTAIDVSHGGTGSTSAGIGAFNNITGYSASGSTGATSSNLVFSTSPTITSPTLVTPALGTPTSGVATNLTGTAAGLTAGTATNLAGGSGGQIPYQTASGTTGMLANGTAGQVLQSNGGTAAPSWTSAGTGTVTAVSVASANGFAGSSSGGATPQLTLSTSVTGLLKGNGTAISAATSGTDYSAGTSALATGILKSTTTTGALSIAVAGDFPTLNQNTTGSAATLTTPRSIYGNNFDGSAALNQIIASTYGGTGNGFTKFTGPATTEKTFTLPNASAAILTDNSAVTLSQGGTGQTSFTLGDIPYYNSVLSTTQLSKLAIGANGTCLISNGNIPTWGACSSSTSISLAPSSADSTSSTNSIENVTATGLTSNNFINLKTTTSSFTGTGLLMDFANGSGSYSGNFVDFRINTTPKFVVSSTGAVTTGIWNGTVVSGTYGGTGVNNGSSTITLGNNLTTSGNFALTLTQTGTTNVTLPTSGTLVNTGVTTLSSLSSIGTITSGTWTANAVGLNYGGTGQTSFTLGDIPYYNSVLSTTQLSKLAIGGNGTCLVSNGNIPTWSTCGSGISRLDQLAAATGTNTINNATFGQTWQWLTSTTQTGFTMQGGTAMTTGSVLGINTTTYNHANGNTGSVVNLAFTEGTTTSGAVTSTTNGIQITPTINTTTSTSGVKTINGISIPAPTLTACTGGATCTYNGINVDVGTSTLANTTLYSATFSNGPVAINGGSGNSSDQLRIGDVAGGNYYKIGRNASGGGTLGFLEFDGLQSGFRGYAFNDTNTTVFNNANSVSFNGLAGVNNRLTVTTPTSNMAAGLQLTNNVSNSGGIYNWILDNRGTIDTPNNRLALFNNSNTEAMTVLPGGNVGINATNPAKKLEINDASGGSLRLTYNATSNLADLSVDSSGNLTLDSSSNRTIIATGDFLKTSVAGVSGAAAGDIWYDSTAGKYKVNEAGTTKTLCNTTDLACGSGGGGISLAPSSPDTTSSTNSIENITATGLTSGNFLNLKTTTSAFTGAGILMDFANASGSYSGNFIDARVNTVAKFVVSSSGAVTAAGLLTGNAGLAVSGGTVTLTSTGASTYTVPTNTASAFSLTDGSNSYLTIDTRSTTSGVSGITFAPRNPSIPTASGSQFIGSTFTPGSYQMNGTSNVTGTGTSSNLSVLFNQPTITNNSNPGITVTEASNILINGAARSANSNLATTTLTNSYGLNILAGSALNATGGAVTNGIGLSVNAPTGATNNYAALFNGGNVGIGDSSPAALLTVGNGDLFQVNSSGAITAAAGITSSGTIQFSGLASAGTQCVQASSTGVLSVTGSACGSGGGGISLAPSSPDTTSSTNSIENITATGLTSGNFLNLKTTTSAFTGAGILMDFANASGSYSGNFIDARVNTVAKFVVSSSGTVTTGIWNGSQIPSAYGGTGGNFSGSSGVVSVNSGTWSANAITQNGVSYGGASNSVSFTAQGGANTVLVANAGAPSFSSAITVGTSVSSPSINGTTSVTTPLLTNAGALSITTTASNGNISLTPNGTGKIVETTGITTGDFHTVTANSFAPAGGASASVFNIAYTNLSTNNGATATSNGILLSPSQNVPSGIGEHMTVGLNLGSFGTNSCNTGGGAVCHKYGIYAASSSGYDDLFNYNGTSIISAAGLLNPAQLNGAVSVTNGGTGASTLASNGVLYGNGTGAVQALAVNAGATQCLTQTSSAAPAWGSCGGAPSLSGISAAGATNTINNADYAQNWQWNSLTSNSAFKLSSTSTAAASNTQTLLNVALSGANSTSTQTTYGAQFANTHTGTASTNIAAYFTASGGTNNYAAVFNAGNVGVGELNPQRKLTVGSDLTATYKAGYFSTDNILFSQLEGGSYFGAVGVKENQFGLNNVGVNWVARDSSRSWKGIAMSSDGRIQTATDLTPGNIYVSSDYGVTWTSKGTTQSWASVAMSADGKIQTAVTVGDYIYVSADYGATWTSVTAPGTKSWFGVAMSADGKIQTATANGDYIYVSYDYGATWTAQTGAGSRTWYRVSMSSDGKIQTAGEGFSGNIYVSTDYGATWTSRASAGSWYFLSVNADGKYQTAVDAAPGYIYTSSDYGTNWTQRTGAGSRSWGAVKVSADGKTQVAVDGSPGYIYISTDYGVTWTAQTGAGSNTWKGVAMSSDAKTITIGGTSTQLYTAYTDTYTSGNVGINTNSPATDLEIGSRDLGNGNAGPIITLGRNTNGTATGAGSINFQKKGGTAGYVWQDNAGNLRINTAAPSNANDTAGTVIGAQTSTRDTKQDITDYTDIGAALQMVTSAPLHTFRYIKEVQGYGSDSPLAKAHIGFIADEVSSNFMWGNSIDQVSVNGLLMASVQALNKKISDLNTQITTLQNTTPANQPLVMGQPAMAGTPIILQSQLYLTGDNIGQAKILTGSNSVRVKFSKPYQYQPIVTATPNGRVGSEYWVSDKDSTGFTIHTDLPTTEDVTFDWHSFAGEGAKLTVSDSTSVDIALVIGQGDPGLGTPAPATATSPTSGTVAGDSTTVDSTNTNSGATSTTSPTTESPTTTSETTPTVDTATTTPTDTTISDSTPTPTEPFLPRGEPVQ